MKNQGLLVIEKQLFKNNDYLTRKHEFILNFKDFKIIRAEIACA